MALEIRRAGLEHLPVVKEMYTALVAQMRRDGWDIWSDEYPRDFVEEDIEQGQFYLLLEGEALCGAFALLPHDNEEGDVPWQDKSAPARYLYRFGIAAGQGGRGLGTQALEAIGGLAKSLGARYLRLFAAYENGPAIGLYRKAGFAQLPGEYGLWIEDGVRLFEYAFEKEV